MAQQNISDLRQLAADVWENNTFGVAASGECGGAPLLRSSPSLLISAAPALSASARVTALASQAPSPDSCSTPPATMPHLPLLCPVMDRVVGEKLAPPSSSTVSDTRLLVMRQLAVGAQES